MSRSALIPPLLVLCLTCTSPRDDAAGPSPASTGSGGTRAAAPGTGGGSGDTTASPDAAAPANTGGTPGTPAPPDAGAPPVAPACGVKDGICLTGCPVTALDPDCPAGGSGPKLDNGKTCTAGASCASGICADGVCCDGACAGACQSCKVPTREGSCLPLRNETDPGQCEGAGRVCTGPSACAEVDQGTQGPSAGISIYAVGAVMAQLVTVGRAGRIAGVRMRVECRAGGSMTVQIQTTSKSLPTGTSLATEIITADGLAAQKQADRLIGFAQPPRLTAGQQIAITALIQDAACTFQSTNDAYPGGYSLVRTTEGEWLPDETDDVYFQTLMLP